MFLKSLSLLVFFLCFMEVALQDVSEEMSGESCAGRTRGFDAYVLYDNGTYKYKFINDCLTDSDIVTIDSLSEISIMEANTFVNMSGLVRIRMANSGIRRLEPGFLKNTPNLKYFYAEMNQLSFIPNNAFNHLNLNFLELSSNDISFIEAGAFANFTVGRLSLWRNKFTEINGSWFHGAWMRSLEFDYNQISTLHADAFKEINGLESLSVRGNKIYFIEDNTFSGLALLSRVDLSWNVLNYINFLGDTEINYVDVSFNLISSMEMNESMKIGEIVIHPNPWNCKCLAKFRKYARKHGVNYLHPSGDAFSNGDDELKKLPDCVVHGDWDSNCSDPEVLRKYFKLVSYRKFDQ